MCLERGDIRRRHRPDAEGGDGLLLQRRVKGDVGGDAQLAPDVVAVDVRRGVGLGVAQRLRLLQDGREVHVRLVHGVHDEVGGAVHDAAHGAHRIQPLHPLQIHQPRDAAAHGGGAAQRHALLRRQRGQLRIVRSDQRFVGCDHMLTPLHSGGDVLIGRVQPAHDLHHRVDGVVVENVVHVKGDGALRQPRLGTAQQHPLHADIVSLRGQLPYAAAYHAEAQQTDVHSTTSLEYPGMIFAHCTRERCGCQGKKRP